MTNDVKQTNLYFEKYSEILGSEWSDANINFIMMCIFFIFYVCHQLLEQKTA